MNSAASRIGPKRRTAAWVLGSVAATFLVAMLTAASNSTNDKDREGAAPYTPSKGEWLCMVLNSRQALVNSQRIPAGADAEYLYDSSKPNTITVRLIFNENTSEAQLRRCADRARRHVTEAAKVHGWEGWLTIDIDRRKVNFEKPTDDLIR